MIGLAIFAHDKYQSSRLVRKEAESSEVLQLGCEEELVEALLC
jgi:hypothetical protein